MECPLEQPATLTREGRMLRCDLPQARSSLTAQRLLIDPGSSPFQKLVSSWPMASPIDG
jgi:hypothetical protein